MLNRVFITAIFIFLGIVLVLENSLAQTKNTPDLKLQVLGSGGPFGFGRASVGYLLWVNGQSRILIDAGGGIFQRFHAAGGSIPDLEIIALSHFHADHSTEVPALLWTSGGNPILVGPSGSNSFPSMEEYANSLFGPRGVFRAVTGGRGYDFKEVDITLEQYSVVYQSGGIKITAFAVPHGPVPTLAYRIDTIDTSIVFSSDQNGTSKAFINFAQDVDYLVMHVAIPENINHPGMNLHAKPSTIGRVAEKIGAGTLILSHLSRIPPISLNDSDGIPDGFEKSFEIIDAGYSGKIIIAEDMFIIELWPQTSSQD